MIKIIGYKTLQKEDGSEFQALVVQGELEAVKSKESGKMYFTARTAKVPSTFNEATCESILGKELPGTIRKVSVEPYEYSIPESGEVITLSHRYEYVGEQEGILSNNVVEKEMVL